jgi:hypothetical protein
VSGKPLIDANTVPRFEFRFDAFRGRSFAEQLRAKIPMFPALLLAHSRQVKFSLPSLLTFHPKKNVLASSVKDFLQL